MIERGSNILLCAHSQYRGVFVGLAQRLKAAHQAEIHLYVGTEQEATHYRKENPDLFASISIARALYAACAMPVADEPATIQQALENERELGIGINALAVSDRHLGRGFALGGFNHPRSRISENTSYAQMLNGYNSIIDYWRRELDEKQPALILNGSKVLCVLARLRSIPVRNLAGSRFKNFYYWAINEFLETPAIKAAYTTAGSSEMYALDAPYASHLRYREHFRRQAALIQCLKTMLITIVRHVYWVVRGYEKAKGYYLIEALRSIWRRRKDVRSMTRCSLPNIGQFGEAPFVFFPLATEPETALQMLSPEYLYQLPAIASVARDLPAGVILVVKEHYAAAGRRPANFYAQVQEFKNVRMMNMSELGMEAVRASRAVVTISGTSGFEGAAMGKPVISFGRHNIYNFLPHVMVVTDEVQLKGYLELALAGGIDEQEAVANGRRFLNAVVAASFDLMDFQPINPDVVCEAALEQSYGALVASLDQPELSNISVLRT